MSRTIGLMTVFLAMTSPATAADKMPDYKAWRDACAKLPSNRDLKGKLPEKAVLPLKTFADFEVALDAYLKGERLGPLGRDKSWVGRAPDAKDFFDLKRAWFTDPDAAFQPFALKLVLPADAVALVMGDLHGDVRSLLHTLEEWNRRKILDGFALRDEKRHVIFLGDYTDRGAYGVEVVYTLLRLKLANPKQVHLARGNHEDFTLLSRYGFLDEFVHKFGREPGLLKLLRAFDLLPAVIYAGDGKNFLQMNHGGMEPGYDPRDLLAAPGEARYQLLGKLKQKTFHDANPGWLGKDAKVLEAADDHLRDFVPIAPTAPRPLGFMWSDFTVFADEPELGYDRSLIFGAAATRKVLERASTDKVRVRAVVRAHQHVATPSALMKRLVAQDGVFRHWPKGETTKNADDTVATIRDRLGAERDRPIPEGSVWTFNVSPDSGYGVGAGFDFVTYGVLSLGTEWNNWRLGVVRLKVF